MEPHVYAWSWSGELLEAAPLSSFAAAHDLEPRRLLAELLLVQAVVGRESEPLRMRGASGELLLTLMPRIGSLQ